MRVWRDAPKPDATRLGARDPVLVVNSAALPGPWLEAEAEGPSKLLVAGGRFVAARLDFEAVAPGLGTGAEFERYLLGLSLPSIEVETRRIERPWHFIEWNAAAIAEDLGGRAGVIAGERHPLAAVLQPERVTLEPGARIDAFAVLDARGGPIRIGPRTSRPESARCSRPGHRSGWDRTSSAAGASRRNTYPPSRGGTASAWRSIGWMRSSQRRGSRWGGARAISRRRTRSLCARFSPPRRGSARR